jgi:hypothetical protein
MSINAVIAIFRKITYINNTLTMITMSCQIQFVNVKIMVTVQLPELAVYDIEMLVTKVCSHLVNVFLLLKKLYNMEEV